MEVINSFFSNIKDKLTNPYFGTLILVIIIHHWELWYSVFNFDSVCTLKDKIRYIKNYSNINLTWEVLIWDIFNAIIFMLFGYLIIVGTRSLVMWVEFQLMPMITGKIVNKNVVRKSDYDAVVKEREEYFDQYEEQRKNVRIFSKTIDEQTEQIKQKNETLLNQSTTITNTIKELDDNKKKLETANLNNKKNTQEIQSLRESFNMLKSDNETKLKQLEDYSNIFNNPVNESFFNSPNKFPPLIKAKVTDLKNNNKWNTFLALGDFIENGGSISGNTMTEMIDEGLVLKKGSFEELTAIGKIIWKYRKVFSLKNNNNETN